MLKIRIVPQTLTDGSKVYDVHVRDCDADPMIFNAINRGHAERPGQRPDLGRPYGSSATGC